MRELSLNLLPARVGAHSPEVEVRAARTPHMRRRVRPAWATDAKADTCVQEREGSGRRQCAPRWTISSQGTRRTSAKPETLHERRSLSVSLFFIRSACF
jgi:hypothetical protein